MTPNEIEDSMKEEVMKKDKECCKTQHEKSASSIAEIRLPELQFRKLIIAKAVCDDGLAREIYHKSVYRKSKPFVNLQLRDISDVPNQVEREVLYSIAGYNRTFAVWFDWGGRRMDGTRVGRLLPSFISYQSEIHKGYKLIDIDTESLPNYMPTQEVEQFERYVEKIVNANLSNRLLGKIDLEYFYGIVRVMAGVIHSSLQKEGLDIKRVYYTGNGFQVYAPYDYDTIKELRNDNRICKSNSNPKQLQRLTSANVIKHKPHLQTCINCDCSFEEFRLSNPSFFPLTHDRQLYDVLEDYLNSFYVSKYRIEDSVNDCVFSAMVKDQVKFKEEIRNFMEV